MQQHSLEQVRVSVSLIFLIHGLIIATWASRIPAFQARLHLSPAVLGRSLMMAAIGSVLAMPAAGWLINKFGSLSIVMGSTLGFGLALPLIAESNTVLTLSAALPPIGRRFRMTIQEVLDVVSPLSRDEYVLSLIQLG